MKKIAIIFALLFITGCSQGLEAEDRPLVSLKYARTLVGLNETENTVQLRRIVGVHPVYTQWCAAFVNSMLHEQGIQGSESVSEYPLTARSFLDWGDSVDVPQYGDVVIFPRGNVSWQGHVGFYVGEKMIDGIDYYIILGGNQDNAVSYELYPAYRAIGVRRASYLQTASSPSVNS